MRTTKLFVASIFSLSGALGLFADEASRRDPDVFFRPPPAREALPEGRLYPEGREFLFGFYSIGGGAPHEVHALLPEEEVQKELATYRAAGVTILGPQYELNDRMLKDAEKHDFHAIYTIQIPMAFHSKAPLELSAEEISRQITEQVKSVAHEERIKLWYLGPEELREWRKNEVAYADAAVKAIREADPLKRPVFVYDPAHRNAKGLRWVAERFDYVAKGAYTNYAGMKDSRVWVRWGIEQEKEALRLADKPAGVPLVLPEMFADATKEEKPLIRRWVRHDVYLGLVSGAKGVLVFSARHRPDFHDYEAYRTAYAEVIRELKGPLKLADAFLFGEERSDLSVDVIEGPAEVAMEFPAGGVKEPVRYPSVASWDAAYGKDRYLILVNSANEPVKAMVSGLSYASAMAHSLFHEEKPFLVGEGEFGVELAPQEVRGYRFERAAATP